MFLYKSVGILDHVITKGIELDRLDDQNITGSDHVFLRFYIQGAERIKKFDTRAASNDWLKGTFEDEFNYENESIRIGQKI